MVLVRPSIVGRFLLLLVGIRPARTGLVEDLEEAAGEPRPEQCGLPSVGLESSQRHLLHHHHLPSGHGCPLAIDHRVGPDPSRWAPWTHRPFCAGGTRYCVFTDSSFQGNHGISVITTPETAASHDAPLIAALRAAAVPAPGADRARPDVPDGDRDAPSSSPPYEVVDLPGRGKGVVATRRIARGTVFMVDHVGVMADIDLPSHLTRRQGTQLMARAMEQLPEPERVLSLARSSGGKVAVAEDVMRTNTFRLEISGQPRMVLFPEISRMNHACQPNAYTRFSESTLADRVIAFRDIMPGEEITISYLEPGLTYEERRKTLQQRWGFTCTCALCSAPAAERAASDQRRERVRELRAAVLGHVQRREFGAAIGLNEEMVRLVAEEALAPHLGEHYEVLARLYLAAADLGSAQRFAGLALEEFARNGGDEAYEGVAEMRQVMGWSG